ncbi:uncharacterized protein METZ01_LOCUS430283, partial [marine metagenome]
VYSVVEIFLNGKQNMNDLTRTIVIVVNFNGEKVLNCCL